MKFLLEHHRGEEKAILVLPRVENRRKQKNPQKRFAKAMDDTHAARLYAQWDRYIEAAGNKTVALELICSVLEAPSTESITEAAKGEQRETRQASNDGQAILG